VHLVLCGHPNAHGMPKNAANLNRRLEPSR
jgi:hypothetical protein